MDKLLRDYAKKRRDQAGDSMEMHAATRKMLQGEVSRTFGKKTAPAAEPAPKFLWGPRLAWIGALTVVVVTVVFSLNSFRSEKSKRGSLELASYKDSPSTPAFNAPAPASPEPTAPPAPAPVLTVTASKPLEEASYAKAKKSLSKEMSPRSDSETISGRLAADTSVSATKAEAPAQTIITRDEKDGYIARGGKITNGALIANSSAADIPHRESLLVAGSVSLDQKENLTAANATTDRIVSTTNSLNTYVFSDAEKVGGYGNGDPTRNFSRTPAVPTTVPAASSAIQTKNFTNFVAQNDRVAAPSGAAAAGVAGEFGVAQRGQAVAQSNASAQNYRQQNLRANLRENFQSPPQPNVLSNFQIVRNESQLKIIDADGSVYEGAIQELPVELENKALADQRAAKLESRKKDTVNSPQSAATQNVVFRVSGDNRTLRRKIVFEGTNFILPQVVGLDALAKNGVRIGQKLQDEQADKRPASQSASQQNVIRGFVNVGGTNEFKIEAVAAP